MAEIALRSSPVMWATVALSDLPKQQAGVLADCCVEEPSCVVCCHMSNFACTSVCQPVRLAACHLNITLL